MESNKANKKRADREEAKHQEATNDDVDMNDVVGTETQQRKIVKVKKRGVK